MSDLQTILVTGSAGFIGNHVSLKLIEQGRRVIGLDNLTPYYDVSLKRVRRARLLSCPGYVDAEIDLVDHERVAELFARHRPDAVIHLAAQAGVRYSLEKPRSYTQSNVDGFLSILEGCRHHNVKHLLFASTSSVYGANTALPFSERHTADHPLTIYAATKRANEMMAHAYGHLFGISATGMRFFTVYGPWGRPDMALFKFTEAILAGRPIDVFNQGNMQRAFTYIDDAADAVLRLLDTIPSASSTWSGERPDPGTSGAARWRIYNIGNSQPVNLLDYIAAIEAALGRKATMNMLPMQPGDVPETAADMHDLQLAIGPRPHTPITEGVRRFVEWYVAHYNPEPA